MKEKFTHHYRPFVIETGKIIEFARAVGLHNPIYFDKNEAQKQGYSDIPIPPTFATVIEYSNEHDYYHFFQNFNLKPENVLHGEQSYEYVQDICANETIKAVLSVERIEYKGNKIFYYLKTIYQNQLLTTVLISKSILIEVKEAAGDRVDK